MLFYVYLFKYLFISSAFIYKLFSLLENRWYSISRGKTAGAWWERFPLLKKLVSLSNPLWLTTPLKEKSPVEKTSRPHIMTSCVMCVVTIVRDSICFLLLWRDIWRRREGREQYWIMVPRHSMLLTAPSEAFVSQGLPVLQELMCLPEPPAIAALHSLNFNAMTHL